MHLARSMAHSAIWQRSVTSNPAALDWCNATGGAGMTLANTPSNLNSRSCKVTDTHRKLLCRMCVSDIDFKARNK